MSRRPLRVNRATSAGGAFAALVAGCALIAACSSSVSGTGTLADTPAPTTSATRATATNTRTSSPDFPSTSATSKPPTTSATPSPTTTGGNAALKSSLAELGANWMHAYANGDEALFCSLSDPTSLKAVFDEKGIGSCGELNIDWSSDPDLQNKLAGFSIPDPQKISVSGTKATVSSANVKPAGLTSLSWIQQSDQTWKVDASILSS